MKTKLKVSVACGLAALLMGFGVQAEEQKTFTFGGDVELDITARDAGDNDGFMHGGRVKLNATGELKGDGYFVKGVAQPLVPFKGSSLGYDDVYLQMGRDSWDVQLGRFEGVDLFPVGKDTVAEHAGSVDLDGDGALDSVPVYGGNKARGRRDDVLHGALHLSPSDAMKFELGVMVNKDGDKEFKAVRPAVVYNAGAVTVRAGMESVDDNGTKAKGFGLGAGFNAGAGTVNASIAKLNAEDAGTDVTSAALNYTQGPWGVGYVTSKADNGGSVDPKVNTLYGAYTVPLFGSKSASVTFAASTSKAKNVTSNDKVNAGRVRFNYAF